MKLFVYCFRDFDERQHFDALTREAGIDYAASPDYPTAETAHLAAGCEAISFTPCRMDAALLRQFRDLGVKYLALRSIGYNHVDLEAARALGMRVSRVAYESDTVAEYAILLMLAGCRRLGQILDRARVQDYSLRGKMGCTLSGSTVGVVGTGAIGGAVVRRLQGFGCRVLAYDPYPNPSLPCAYVPLEQLWAESDLITLHCPVTAENVHLVNAAALARMKRGVILVNTARGLLVDTDALIAALVSGQVGYAGLDVLENEDGLYFYNRTGDVIDNPQMAQLRSFPNVMLTPHTAFYTGTVVGQMATAVVRCACDMAAGRENPLIVL